MNVSQVNNNGKVNMLKEFITITSILLVNMIHPFISIIVNLCLLNFSLKGKTESIKALILSFTIYFLNPGIFKIDTSILPILRWIIFFVCIFNILKTAQKQSLNKKWFLIFSIWAGYTLLVSIIKSNLPMISIMKLFMFYIGFLAVNIGVIEGGKYYDWKRWIFVYFLVIQLSSLLFIKSPIGYFRNGSGFQGILNQPNAFGIITAVIISLYMYLKTKDEYLDYSSILNISIILGIIMLLASKSRTSMMAISLSSFIFIVVFLKKIILKRKLSLATLIMILFMLIVIFIVSIFNYENIASTVNELIYKGGNENILYSSQNALNTQEDAIKNSLLLGNGFGVEWYPEQEKSFEISLSHPIEKRNVLLALLSETGIIGTIIFGTFLVEYTGIFVRNGLRYVDGIFISTLLINFGEMVLFSGNGIGMFVWFMLAFYKSEIS